MSWRSLSAKQVLTKMMPYQQLLGISRLADLSQFVGLKIHIVQAVRTNLIRGQVSTTTGKGWRLVDALCGAYGEALERYSAAHPLPHQIVRQDASSIPCAPLHRFGYATSFTPKDWVTAEDLLCNEPYLLPALEVHFPYYGPDLRHSSVRPHTSGLAGGATLVEAALFGLFEVIERHASSDFFCKFKQVVTGAMIRPASVTSPKIQRILQELQQKGYDFFIFRIDTILPTYYMAIFDATNLGPKLMVAGIGCSVSEEKAIDGAVLEALQAIVIAAQGAREDLTRIGNLYNNQQVGKNSPFYLLRQILTDLNPSHDFDSDTDDAVSDTQQTLNQVLQLLKAQGVPAVYQCNLSQPQLPLSVVKMIVPTMFDSRSNPYRGSDAVAAS